MGGTSSRQERSTAVTGAAEVAALLPPRFELGVATASYQIEGAIAEDGRLPSIWDTFSHTPGKVANGDTGDVACDHYHRYLEDVALMGDLGVDSYRFSVAWPRVQPTGSGASNAAGLDFYDRLVDALLAKGISPAITLYHWDLPQPLEDAGGWRNRDTAARFADYSRIVVQRLGDRVGRWITLNEPFCSAMLGYASGRHAPGLREGGGALAAAHHLLLGHGLATQVLRSGGAREVGVTLNLQPVSPASDDPADVAAADRALLRANLLFTDPVLAGRYPGLADAVYGGVTDFAFLHPGDLATIAQPLDFLGVNYYFPTRARAAEHREPDPARRTADDVGVEDVIVPGEELTAMGWPVEAEGLHRLLRWLKDTYPALPPVLVTENGRACDDVVTPAGEVHDAERICYLADHLRAVAGAVADGVDVRGYYCWSLLDNFEWSFGYAKRFGLVYVDYATQERIPKDSFRWFGQLTRALARRR
ncbi:MAG TPA: GH1 family beta-glucosidase [Actinomycetales bacterium]|nr:GH1 family beta-glucosidase [Actinomycetales bacterium]